MKIKKAFKILTPLIFLSSLQAVIVSSCNSNNKPSPDPTPSDVKTKKEFKACCINADQGQFNIEYTNNKYTDCNLTKASKDFKAIDFNFNNGIISSNDGFEYIITSIGDHAFENNTNLVGDIYIPNTIKSIGKYSFTHSGLNGIVHIPDSIDSIGAYAFADTKIQILDLTEHTSKIVNYANNIVNESAIIYVPKDLLQAYKNAEGWNTIADRIYAKSEPIPPQPQFITDTLDSKYIGGSKGTFDIGYYQGHSDYCQILSVSDDFTAKNFNFNDGIIKKSETEKITISNIKEGCFKNCLGLTGTLTIPSTISHINPYTFAGCLKLNKVVINEGIDSIDDYAFAGCESLDLETIILPNSLENIGKCAFKDCNKICKNSIIKLQNSIKHIADGAFSNSNIETLNLEDIDHVIEIDSNPLSEVGFLSKNSIKRITFVDETINHIFSLNKYWLSCQEIFSNIETVTKTFLASTISGETGTFTLSFPVNHTLKSTLLSVQKDFVVDSNFWNMNNGVFKYNDQNYQICSIAANAFDAGSTHWYFKKCNLAIPSTVKTIGNQAFYGNSRNWGISDKEIIGIQFNEGIEDIGKEAFYKCNDLIDTTIKLPNSIKHISDNAFSKTNMEILDLTTLDHVIDVDSDLDSKNSFLYDTKINKIIFKDDKILNLYANDSHWSKYKNLFVKESDKVIKNIPGSYFIYGTTTIENHGYVTIEFNHNNPLDCKIISVKDFCVGSGLSQEAFDFNKGKFNYEGINYQITSIGKDALRPSSISSFFSDIILQIPSTIKTIEDGAFYGNSRNWGISDKEIIGIQFNKGLEDIGKEAFYKCNDLIDTTIKLPNSIKHIGDNAFAKTNIEILDLTTLDHVIDVDSDLDSKNSFLYDTKINKIIFKDDKILNLYANDSHWSKYKNLFVKESNKVTKNIPAYVFAPNTYSSFEKGFITIEFTYGNTLDCKIIKADNDVAIEDCDFDFHQGYVYFQGVQYRITSIGDSAFKPKSIRWFFKKSILQIPFTVKTIGDQAFYGNSRNTSLSDKEIIGIEFNEGLEDIGKEAFYKCNDLIDTTIKLPNSIKHISDNAFGKTNMEILDLTTLDHVIGVDSDLDSKNSFLYDTKINKIIFKDDKILNLYANDSHWSKYKNLFKIK